MPGRGTYSHNGTGTSQFPMLCWGRWDSSTSEGQWVSFQLPIYLPRASSGLKQEWLAGALSSDTRDLMPCVCVRWRCSSKKPQWGASDTAFEGFCLSLVVDKVTAASQPWMRRRLIAIAFFASSVLQWEVFPSLCPVKMPQLFDRCSSTPAHLQRKSIVILPPWPYFWSWPEHPVGQNQLTKSLGQRNLAGSFSARRTMIQKEASLSSSWARWSCLQHWYLRQGT